MNLFALGLGVGALFAYRATRAPRGTRARPISDLAADPSDSVQGFDEVSELEVSPLDVDALSTEDAEAAQDLAALEVELDRDDEIELASQTEDIDVNEAPDDDRAVADGQNWVEALETSAIENGAAPGRPLDDLVDGEEILRAPHSSPRRDTPVADLGSGGRRGL